MLSSQLILIDWTVGGFTWCRIVPLWASILSTISFDYTSVSRFLRCHLALLEHLLFVVFVHDAHLLVRVWSWTHSWILSLGLIPFLNILSRTRWTFDKFHASRISILFRSLNNIALTSLCARTILFTRILKLNVTLEVLIEFNISDGIIWCCSLGLLIVLMEWCTSVALLRVYSNTLRRRTMTIIFDIGVTRYHSIVLCLIVTHARCLLMLRYFLTLWYLARLASLMHSIGILVRVTTTGWGLLTLLTIVGRVCICVSSRIVVHADSRTTRAKRECILLSSAWSVAWVAYAICTTSRLVLTRFLLFYLYNNLLLIKVNLSISARMILFWLHGLRTLLLRSTALHHYCSDVVFWN